jgi:hypothetical protein
MESADSIVELYREHTQLSEPSDELVGQLLALLAPGEAVLFTCGWTDMSEKWGHRARRRGDRGRAGGHLLIDRILGRFRTVSTFGRVAVRPVWTTVDVMCRECGLP